MARKSAPTRGFAALAEIIKRKLPNIEETMRVSDPKGDARTLLDEMGVTDSSDSDEDREIAERMLAIYGGQPIANNVRELGAYVCNAILRTDYNAFRRLSARLKRIVKYSEQTSETPVQKLIDLKHAFMADHGRPPLWNELRAQALKVFPKAFDACDSRQWSRWRKVPGLNRLRSGKPGRPKKGDK